MSALGKYMAKYGNKAKDVLSGAAGEAKAAIPSMEELAALLGKGAALAKGTAQYAVEKHPFKTGAAAGAGGAAGLAAMLGGHSEPDEDDMDGESDGDEDDVLKRLGLA